MAAPTVYLVSGASRGIGLGLVALLAARSDVIVFAGARNPATADGLLALQAKYPSKVHVLKLTSANAEDNVAAVEQVKRIAGKLNIVIANAGIASYWGKIIDTPVEEMRNHYEVNVVGPLVLFQATWPLLQQSRKPMFAITATIAGSIAVGGTLPAGLFAYGASKAAANFLAMKLHSEHPELISIPIHPGFVNTEATQHAAEQDPFIAGATLIAVEESAQGFMKVLDAAKREEAGPRMIGYDGTVFPW